MTSPAAADIVRGTMRLLLDLDLASLPEFTLATGRRVDLMALGRDGRLVAIEVKSCRDGLPDRPQMARLSGLCRPVLFRRGAGLPARAAAGGRRADRGRPLRREPDPASPRHAAWRRGRRRALLLRFARTAALRLQGAADPDAGARARLSAQPPRPATPRSGSGRCCPRLGRRTGRRRSGRRARRGRTSARPRSRRGRCVSVGARARSREIPASATAGTARAARRDRRHSSISTPTSSNTSRRSVCSSDSPGSTKPASVEYMPGGKRGERPSRQLVAMGDQHDHRGIGARESCRGRRRAVPGVAALDRLRWRRRTDRRSGGRGASARGRGHRPAVPASSAGSSRQTLRSSTSRPCGRTLGAEVDARTRRRRRARPGRCCPPAADRPSSATLGACSSGASSGPEHRHQQLGQEDDPAAPGRRARAPASRVAAPMGGTVEASAA